MNPSNSLSFLPGQEIELSIDNKDSKGNIFNFTKPIWVLPDEKVENADSIKIKLEKLGTQTVEVDLAQIDSSSLNQVPCFNNLHQKVSFVVNKECPALSKLAISGSQIGYVGSPMNFNVVGIDECMSVNSFSWSFGDNQNSKKDNFQNTGLNGLKKNVQHTYQTPGTYQIQLSLISKNSKEPVIITQQVLIKYPGPFDWIIKDKGVCSVKACGLKGTQKMTFICQDARGVAIENEYCNLQEKPRDLIECATEACPITDCQNGAITFPTCKDCPTGQYLNSSNQCIPSPKVECSFNIADSANSNVPFKGALSGVSLFPLINLTNAKSATYICTGMNNPTTFNITAKTISGLKMGTQDYSCILNYKDFGGVIGSCESNSVTAYLCKPDSTANCLAVSHGLSTKTCSADGLYWSDCKINCDAGYHVENGVCELDPCSNGAINKPTCNICSAEKYYSSNQQCENIPTVSCSLNLAEVANSPTPVKGLVNGAVVFATVNLTNAKSATYQCTGMNSAVNLSVVSPAISNLKIAAKDFSCTINYKNLGNNSGSCVSNKVTSFVCAPNAEASCATISNGTQTKVCAADGMSWGSCTTKCETGYHLNGSTCAKDICLNDATNYPTCDVCPSDKYLNSSKQCVLVPKASCTLNLADKANSSTPLAKAVDGSSLFAKATLTNIKSATYQCSGMSSATAISVSAPVLSSLTIGSSDYTCTINYKDFGDVAGSCVSNKVLSQICVPNKSASCVILSNGTSTKVCSADGMSWGACTVKCDTGYHESNGSCAKDVCLNDATNYPKCNTCIKGKYLNPSTQKCEDVPAVECSAIVSGASGSSTPLDGAMSGTSLFGVVKLANAKSATYQCTGMSSSTSLNVASPVMSSLKMGAKDYSCTINYKNIVDIAGTCTSNVVKAYICNPNEEASCGTLTNGTKTKKCAATGLTWGACEVKCDQYSVINAAKTLCIKNTCANTTPANAVACDSKLDANLTTNTKPKVLVETCTAGNQCEYQCDPTTYKYQAGTGGAPGKCIPKFVFSPGRHCDIGGDWGWVANACPKGYETAKATDPGMSCPAGTKREGDGCYVSFADGQPWANYCSSSERDPKDECCFWMCKEQPPAYEKPCTDPKNKNATGTQTCRKDSTGKNETCDKTCKITACTLPYLIDDQTVNAVTTKVCILPPTCEFYLSDKASAKASSAGLVTNTKLVSTIKLANVSSANYSCNGSASKALTVTSPSISGLVMGTTDMNCDITYKNNALKDVANACTASVKLFECTPQSVSPASACPKTSGGADQVKTCQADGKWGPCAPSCGAAQTYDSNKNACVCSNGAIDAKCTKCADFYAFDKSKLAKCVPNQCLAATFANASPCENYNKNVVAGTKTTLVHFESCNAAKSCEYSCNTGYFLNAKGACEKAECTFTDSITKIATPVKIGESTPAYKMRYVKNITDCTATGQSEYRSCDYNATKKTLSLTGTLTISSCEECPANQQPSADGKTCVPMTPKSGTDLTKIKGCYASDNLNSKTFSTSGTFTVPAGVSSLNFVIRGGGAAGTLGIQAGGGAVGGTHIYAGKGGGAGQIWKGSKAVKAGDVLTVKVGKGGLAATSYNGTASKIIAAEASSVVGVGTAAGGTTNPIIPGTVNVGGKTNMDCKNTNSPTANGGGGDGTGGLANGKDGGLGTNGYVGYTAVGGSYKTANCPPGGGGGGDFGSALGIDGGPGGGGGGGGSGGGGANGLGAPSKEHSFLGGNGGDGCVTIFW
jgi:hypothetical protein